MIWSLRWWRRQWSLLWWWWWRQWSWLWWWWWRQWSSLWWWWWRPVWRRSPANVESESDVRISFRHCFVFVLRSSCSAALHLCKGSLFRCDGFRLEIAIALRLCKGSYFSILFRTLSILSLTLTNHLPLLVLSVEVQLVHRVHVVIEAQIWKHAGVDNDDDVDNDEDDYCVIDWLMKIC